MRENTKRISDPYDLSKLSQRGTKKLKRAAVLDEVGRVLGEDLKQYPIKFCALMVSSLGFASVMAGSLALKMRSKDVRERFKQAAERPIHLAFYESALKHCPDTGEINVDSLEMLKRQSRAIKMNVQFLIENAMSQLPRCNLTDFAQKMHIRLSRYEMPSVFDEDTKKQFRGAVFALASLGSLEPSDIAQHLSGRDQEIYLQDYATLEI